MDVPAGHLYLGETIGGADLAEELTAVDDEWAAAAADVETVDVPLEKADVRVTSLALAWVPSA